MRYLRELGRKIGKALLVRRLKKTIAYVEKLRSQYIAVGNLGGILSTTAELANLKHQLDTLPP